MQPAPLLIDGSVRTNPNRASTSEVITAVSFLEAKRQFLPFCFLNLELTLQEPQPIVHRPLDREGREKEE